MLVERLNDDGFDVGRRNTGDHPRLMQFWILHAGAEARRDINFLARCGTCLDRLADNIRSQSAS
jgi:hypothetical protein